MSDFSFSKWIFFLHSLLLSDSYLNVLGLKKVYMQDVTDNTAVMKTILNVVYWSLICMKTSISVTDCFVSRKK